MLVFEKDKVLTGVLLEIGATRFAASGRSLRYAGLGSVFASSLCPARSHRSVYA